MLFFQLPFSASARDRVSQAVFAEELVQARLTLLPDSFAFWLHVLASVDIGRHERLRLSCGPRRCQAGLDQAAHLTKRDAIKRDRTKTNREGTGRKWATMKPRDAILVLFGVVLACSRLVTRPTQPILPKVKETARTLFLTIGGRSAIIQASPKPTSGHNAPRQHPCS